MCTILKICTYASIGARTKTHRWKQRHIQLVWEGKGMQRKSAQSLKSTKSDCTLGKANDRKCLQRPGNRNRLGGDKYLLHMGEYVTK